MTVTERLDGAVARIEIDRPEVANAFDGPTVTALGAAVDRAATDPAVRVIVLSGAGKHFSAGADLSWMRRMADADATENLADARALADLMRTVDRSPKPVVVRVQGAAMAGATGLAAAADIVVASTAAVFAVSEVRLGLIPAVISPYLVRAIGARQARRFFLTAERISAETAHRIGLVHELAEPDELDGAVDRIVAALLAGSPAAIRAAKDLVADVDGPIDDVLIEETARRIAERRASPDAREGLAAFLEKRKPEWPA
ncbi:enoyl-CoA hydratase-related protein [Chthonobacter albigriseus]|uniref:enoyl-CoA hydratase-related protein n=1 Tax=Chthonobacter albigriseus TaxID=1683161 RepID=UPI0015EF2B5D